MPDERARVPEHPPAGLVWDGQLALLGAGCAMPGALVAWTDPSSGLALMLGTLPAAAVGIHGPRSTRWTVVVVGACIGIGMTVGALLAQAPVVAVGGLFALALGSAVLSSRLPVGRLLMTLAVPMVGAGLSYGDDVASAVDLMLLMMAGAAYGWLLSLCWPSRPGRVRAAELPARRPMVEYGIRLGSAGATCAAIGFAFDLDHVGWATAACLLVMRPTVEMTELRGVGRAASVVVGAFAAWVMVRSQASTQAVAVAAFVALSALAATRPSRWYVTGGFTTFLVVSLLVYGRPEEATGRFLERATETVIGVSVALFFGVLLPRLRAVRS